MSLRLNKVGYTYGRRQGYEVRALEGVSLELQPGQLVLIVGETGSGKSTLLRIAAGLLEPDRGTATIEGVALTPESARGRIGLIFQDPESQLFADTLADDVAFGPRNLGKREDEARSLAMKALERVGLDATVFSDRSPFSLSGGEARRAAIAGVLAMMPSYLLADEPTAGLDSRGRRAVRDVLLAERERCGVVIVSHAAEEFLAYADALIVLRSGTVAWAGSAARAMGDLDGLASAGLRLPDVLEVQRLAQQRLSLHGTASLDPTTAADRLASASGGA